jgi:hypothetical protein
MVQPQRQQIKSKMDKLMKDAMDGNPHAIAMLMAYGE